MELERAMFNVITSVFLLMLQNIVKSLYMCIILTPVFNSYSFITDSRELMHFTCRSNFTENFE